MVQERTKPEILNKALNDKFPCSEARLLALDQALADETSRQYLKENAEERVRVQQQYRDCIRQTAQELRQVSHYLFCKIPEHEMGSTKDDDQAPESLKKLPMQVNKIISMVIDEILKAPDFNARTIIMERWAAIMQQSLMLGDFVTASAICTAYNSLCVKRLNIEAGLSAHAREMFRLMQTGDNESAVNMLNKVEFADLLMSHRCDLVIPHHGDYKSLLMFYKDKQQNLIQFELARKYKLLNDAIELFTNSKAMHKLSYREMFTKYIEENREIKNHILELAEKIKTLMEKQALGIDEDEDKSSLKNLEHLYSAALKARLHSQAEIQKLWKKVLRELAPEQQKKFENAWKELEQAFRDEHSRYQRVIADIIHELNDRKRRLGGPIAFSDLNHFQQEIALGMTGELFSKLDESNYERSRHRVKKPDEAPVCEIFRDKPFDNIIFSNHYPVCVKEAGNILALKGEIKRLNTSLKALARSHKDIKNGVHLNLITDKLEGRNTLQEIIAFLQSEVSRLQKGKHAAPETIKIVEKLLAVHKELETIFDNIAKDNPSVPVHAKKAERANAPVAHASAVSPGQKQKELYKKRGSLIFGTFTSRDKPGAQREKAPQPASSRTTRNRKI